MSTSTHRYQPTGGTFVFLVAALTLAQACGTMLTVAMPSIAPAVAAALGVPAYMIGYQVSLLYIGVLFGLTLGANFTARWGACRAMQVALGLQVTGMLLACTGSPILLLPGSLLLGFGYAPLTPASSHLLLRFTPEQRRNVVFSLKQTGVPLGSMFAAATAATLTLTFNWQVTLAIYAGLVAIVVLALQSQRDNWDDDRNPAVPLAASPVVALGIMWRNPMLRTLAFIAGCLSCGQLTIQNFTVTMSYEHLNMSLVQSGMVLASAQLGGVIGRVFWGWTADRLGNCVAALSLLATIMLIAALACIFLAPSWPLVLVVALFFFFGATSSGWHGAFLGEVARIAPPGKVSAATSGTLFIGNVAAAATPVLFAAIYASIHNYAHTFGMVAIPALVCLYLLWRASRWRTT